MDVEKIKYLYDVTDEIAVKYDKYLNINNADYCCDISLTPYVNIRSKDFSSPITHYIKYHDTEIYEDIIQDAKEFDNRLLKCNTLNKNKIALEYVKNKTNAILLLVHESSIKELSYYLNQVGTVSITKKITMNDTSLKNLLCDIYINDVLKYNKLAQRLQYLDNKASYIDNDIMYCIILELDDYNINEIKNDIKKHVSEDKLHIITNHVKVVDLCSTLFHHKSLKFLDQRVLRNWISEEFTKTFVKLNVIKKWLCTNVSLLDRDAFIMLDEGTIATLGVRNVQKFKCVLLLGDIDVDTVQNPATRIPFLKVVKPYDTNINIFCKNWDDMKIYDDKYFYYNNGIKILNVYDAFDIKLESYSLKDHIDFIAMIRIFEIHRLVLISSKRIKKKKYKEKEVISQFLKYDRMLLYSLHSEII